MRFNQLESFKNYRDNYLYESRVVINNAVYYNKNISPELKNFTVAFIDYAD